MTYNPGWDKHPALHPRGNPFVIPQATDFAQYNVSANLTITQVRPGISLERNSTVGPGLEILAVVAPEPPFTIEMAFQTHFTGDNYGGFELIVYDYGDTEKVHTFGQIPGPRWCPRHWSAPNNWVADEAGSWTTQTTVFYNNLAGINPWAWWKLVWGATDWVWSASPNALDWRRVHTGAVDDYLPAGGAKRIGFSIEQSAGRPMVALVGSWRVY